MYSIDIKSDNDCYFEPVELGRYYWAVGAGLFTSQQLHIPTSNGTQTVNLVYDCGTNSSRVFIEREIDEYLSLIGNADIDFLFISHLDKDHISGIPYLAKQLGITGNKIKRIYYPFLEMSELVYLASSPQNQSIRNILFSIDDYLNEFADEVVAIAPENMETTSSISLPELSFGANPVSFDVWNFSFSVLPSYDKRDGFYNDLSTYLNISKNDLLSKINDPRFRDNLFINSLNLLKQCYRKQWGLANLNNTSLCVYSGPPENKFNAYKTFSSKHMSLNKNSKSCLTSWAPKPGWIGTGDSPLASNRNVNDFNKLFDKFKIHCNSITVPHHGSDKNWNDSIMTNFPSGSYCFAGANGRYGHPSPYVVNQINNLGHFFINMTEFINTRFSESYSIYYR